MAVPLEGHVTAAEAAFTLGVPASTLGYVARYGCGRCWVQFGRGPIRDYPRLALMAGSRKRASHNPSSDEAQNEPCCVAGGVVSFNPTDARPTVKSTARWRRGEAMDATAVTQVSSSVLPDEIKRKTGEGAGIVEVMDPGGTRTHVVIRDDVYRRLLGPTLREMVPPIGDDIEFDPPRMGDDIFRPVDFS
jgi:hypothetical protein